MKKFVAPRAPTSSTLASSTLASSTSSGLAPSRTPAPTDSGSTSSLTYVYHGTRCTNIQGIQDTGLDPKLAGKIGGSTAAAVAVRKPTKLDEEGIWLGKSQTRSEDYARQAQQEAVVLRALHSSLEHNSLEDHKESGYRYLQVIPAKAIQYLKNDNTWGELQQYKKEEARIFFGDDD